MEKPKKTKSRTGCKMCKTKRLKCDETKPACNQCVRRGRLCPGYRREIKWSTMITAKDGKTKHPAEDAFHLEKDESPLIADVVPLPHDATISGLTANSGEGECEQNQNLGIAATGNSDLSLDVEDWANVVFQSQDLVNIRDDVSKIPESEIEWTEWTGEANLFASSVDDQDVVRAANESCTDIATLDPIFMDSPLMPRDQARCLTFPKANPVDLPTTLIEYWFTHVCSMWCAYDSPQNWYRNLAGNTWQHSEPVYYALQAMSASVLVDSLPHLKQALPKLTVQAAQSIQHAVQVHAAVQTDSTSPLPTDLLLAVLGMGTSICWSDPRQLGFWFLDQARGLLKRYNREGDLALDMPGQQTIEYFRQALIYWEMLANVVTKDYQNILKSRRSRFKKRIRRAMSMGEPATGNNGTRTAGSSPGKIPKALDGPLPHPWTGISGDIQQTFGLVMGLCQNRCVARNTDSNLSADNLCDALCDIELAHDLEKELLSFDFNGDREETKNPPNETGDPNAPLSHLVDTAEAYRLASLLHLYLAFSDLEVKFVQGNSTSSTGESVPPAWTQAPAGVNRGQALLTLTLRLVDVLKRIPADSGARCIQPILLISAAAGLKFDVPTQSMDISWSGPSKSIHSGGTIINRSAMPASSVGSSMLFDNNGQKPGIFNPLDASSTFEEMPQITSLTLEISAARRFIVSRLGALQQSLPPRPIGVALALTRAIWSNYDSADERLREMHWMNTMVKSGLQTLFG